MNINFPFPDSIERFIDEQVVSKGYKDATEYILSLIHQERARVDRLEFLLLEGLDSGSPTEVTADWWEQKRTQLVQNVNREKHNSVN